MQQMMQQLLATMEEMEANRKAYQEEMREEIKSGQAEMRSTLDEWLMDLKDGRKETTACNITTETKFDPGLIKSIKEHQDIPQGEAAAMPVGEPNKRRRVYDLVRNAARRGRKDPRNRGSRRKSAAACRKMFRSAKVAWRKRNSSGRFGSKKTVNSGRNG
jgi:hypothetical protein